MWSLKPKPLPMVNYASEVKVAFPRQHRRAVDRYIRHWCTRCWTAGSTLTGEKQSKKHASRSESAVGVAMHFKLFIQVKKKKKSNNDNYTYLQQRQGIGNFFFCFYIST